MKDLTVGQYVARLSSRMGGVWLRCAWVVGLAVLMLLTLAGLAVKPVAASGPAPAVHLLSATGDGLTLELSAPSYATTTETGPDGIAYTRLFIPGFESSGRPGAPALPQQSALLVVPPGAELKLEVQVLAEESTYLKNPVYPAPALVADGPIDPLEPTGATALQETFARDAAAYAAGVPAVATPVVLEEAGYVRDLRLARLTFYPLQYTPATGRLRHIRQARVQVHFSAPLPPKVGGSEGGPSAPLPPKVGGSEGGPFDALVSRIVINPEQVRLWRANPPAPAFAPVALPFDQVRYRITLRQTGIYQISYDDLMAAGVPLNELDPRHLQLYLRDQEVAIEVIGEEDGHFDPTDSIRFYGQALDSPYTDANTYWLVPAATAGRRMATRSVAPQGGAAAATFPSTQHFEQNHIYRSTMPATFSLDHWYWGQTYVVSRGSVYTLTVPFTVEDPAAEGVANLTLELWGASYDSRVNPDHHSRIYINGSAIGDVRWDGAVPFTPTLTFDQALLRPGDNTLTLYTPGDVGARDQNGQPWEVTWLNFFNLSYQRGFKVNEDRLGFTPLVGEGEFLLTGFSAADVVLYDVTDPRSPIHLTDAQTGGTAGAYNLAMHDVVPAGGAYWAAGPGGILTPLAVVADQPSDLHNPAAGADYLVITHADFQAGVEPLVQLRRGQGLRVRVVDVQDIYDEFNGGLLDPAAIRDFIRYAYFYWPAPAPSYVLLVGDGTYDFLDHEGYHARTFIPPYLASVDPVLGETAADNRYVTVAGDDIMPDLHLGRLPVNNQAELAAMVDKIVSYETTPTPGAWRTRAVFVADNPDSAGQFHSLSDQAVAHLPSTFEVQKIYLGSPAYPTSAAVLAQQATLQAFNNGALLFNYVGHSSISNWAGELLFGVSVLPQVNNNGFYPVVLPMTCLEGSYQNPRFPGLGESVVRLSGRGALASWSPTGLGIASGHDYLHQGFYDALFNWGQPLLGPATTAGKLNLFINGRFSDGSPRFHDLLDTYVLFGDPATRIAVPQAQLSVSLAGPNGQLTQGDLVTYTVTFGNSGPALAKGVILTVTLPGGLNDLAWSSQGPALTPRATGSPHTLLAWDVADLSQGETGQITITGRIAWEITAADLPFSVEVAITGRVPESDYSDNRAGPFTATLAPADLRLAQVTMPARPVQPGERVTFTLKYINEGPGAAGVISLTLPLPPVLEDVQVSQIGVSLTARPGPAFIWDVGPMRSGDVGSVTVSGRVPITITGHDLPLSVTARIATGWVDPDPGNNIGETGTIVVLIPDAYEPDNSPDQAIRVTPPLTAQPHTYNYFGDQDWTVFDARPGTTYLIRTVNLSPDADTVLTLWDAAGNLLAKNDDATPGGRSSVIIWTAPNAGDYYVMVTGYTPTYGFSYELEIVILRNSYMPLLYGS